MAASALAGLGPNKANHQRLAGQPIEDYRYDAGKRCKARTPRGTRAMLRWLGRHTRGESWGVYRCEKLPRGNYSLHAERRAIDWHMDARKPRMKRQALTGSRKRTSFWRSGLR